MWQSPENTCVGWRPAKSQLPANFNRWKGAYHQLKLLWKTETWGNFEGAVK